MRSIHVAILAIATTTCLLSSCGFPAAPASDSASPTPSPTPSETPAPSPTPSPEDALETLDTAHFTMLFPSSDPEKEVKKEDNLTQTNYTIEMESGDTMSILVLDLDPGIPFNLPRGMAGGAKSAGGEVLASRSVTVDGWPALRSRFSMKSDTTTGTGWAAIIDKNQDLVLAMTYEGWSMPGAKVAPALYERALASLEIK